MLRFWKLASSISYALCFVFGFSGNVLILGGQLSTLGALAWRFVQGVSEACEF